MFWRFVLNYVPKALHFLLLSSFTINIKQIANDETYVDFNINWNTSSFLNVIKYFKRTYLNAM